MAANGVPPHDQEMRSFPLVMRVPFKAIGAPQLFPAAHLDKDPVPKRESISEEIAVRSPCRSRDQDDAVVPTIAFEAHRVRVASGIPRVNPWASNKRKPLY